MDSFNTQPRGGGCQSPDDQIYDGVVSTHSRAEAAAVLKRLFCVHLLVSTHSRAEAAAPAILKWLYIYTFQHTAARRRLL